MIRKKILMLFCGGTISMTSNSSGKLDIDAEKEAHLKILELAPHIEGLANIHMRFVVNIDSSNMQKDTWEKITDIIEEEYDNYDGFVITTGTDTMAYMSSALSFSLSNIGKPVAITGSQIPLEEIRTDARTNLINVIMVACMDTKGVLVVFGDRIIWGARAEKNSDIALNAFETVNQQDLGKTNKIFSELDLKFAKNYHDRKKPAVFKNGFDDNIVCIHNSPGLNNKYIDGLIDGGVKIIIFRTFGTGNLPECLFSSVEKAHNKHVPIIVSTQCKEGSTVMEKYTLGKKAVDLGVIEAYDMSIESVITKCMWMLGQKIPFKKFKDVFQQDIVGEIDKTIAFNIINKNPLTEKVLEEKIKVEGKDIL